jgi:hypothetical protein
MEMSQRASLWTPGEGGVHESVFENIAMQLGRPRSALLWSTSLEERKGVKGTLVTGIDNTPDEPAAA